MYSHALHIVISALYQGRRFFVRMSLHDAVDCFTLTSLARTKQNQKKLKVNRETHRTERLTWPAVADIAINKIFANGTIVAGSRATFVNIHFTEVPRETWRTAKKTYHTLKSWGCLRALSLPSCESDKLYLRSACFYYSSKTQMLQILLFKPVEKKVPSSGICNAGKELSLRQT